MAHSLWQMGVSLQSQRDSVGRRFDGCRPGYGRFSPLESLCMVAGGPFATLLTGTFALWVAFAAEGHSPVQAGGAFALFGAWSFVGCAVNLLPLRTKRNYSDGAQIYQLLSDGPWGDYHRVAAVVGSTLVTPLRPRDYDSQAILRAAHSITQGIQGLALRLYAYGYFLDHGRI